MYSLELPPRRSAYFVRKATANFPWKMLVGYTKNEAATSQIVTKLISNDNYIFLGVGSRGSSDLDQEFSSIREANAVSPFSSFLFFPHCSGREANAFRFVSSFLPSRLSASNRSRFAFLEGRGCVCAQQNRDGRRSTEGPEKMGLPPLESKRSNCLIVFVSCLLGIFHADSTSMLCMMPSR